MSLRQDLDALVAEWRAVAEKHEARAERADDAESLGFHNGMAERSAYCADQLSALLTKHAGESERIGDERPLSAGDLRSM